MARVQTFYDGIRAVMQSAPVRAGLRVRAEQVASRANSEDPDLRARVEEGTRPKGRPFARAVSDGPDAAAKEWGDSKTERRRTLGRAAGI